MVLNGAACLIVRKHKFDSISSTIRERDVLHWLRFNSESMYKLCILVYNCLHDVAPVYLSTMCQPVSENIGRRSLRSAARGCLAVPITRTVHCGPCSFTVVGLSTRNSLPARPVINPNILLPPTQDDLSLRQSICFIITLVTVISLLERANITVPYKHTCNRYVQNTDRMTDGRLAKVTSRGKIGTVIIFHLFSFRKTIKVCTFKALFKITLL